MENGTGKNENWENWCFSKMHFVHRGVEPDTRATDTMALRSSEIMHVRGQWLPLQYSLLSSNTQPRESVGELQSG